LQDVNGGLAGKALTFALGSEAVTALTDINGQAMAQIGLFTLPGTTDLRVYFSGDPTYDASFTVQPGFQIFKQNSVLSLTVPITPAQSGADSGVVATLEDVTGRRLREKTVLFVVDDPDDTLPPYAIPVITQWQGLARLGGVPLPQGSYQVMATFGTTVTVGTQVLRLKDEAFEGAVAMGIMNIDAFNASVTVTTSSIEIPVNATVQVTVTVGTAGSSSDVTLAQVLYELLDSNGNVVFSQVGSVDNNGVSTASIPGPSSGGTYTLRVTVVGGYFTSAPLTSIVEVNEKPTAADDSYSADEDTPLNVVAPGVLGNDTDPNSGDTLTASLLTDPAHGTLVLNVDGSFSYTPDADFNGNDSFTYEAGDGFPGNLPDLATVTITVNPVNDAPVAADDAYSANEDVTFAVSAPGVLGNDSDIDGDGLTASLLTGPAHGTLALNAGGGFSYSPSADYNGPDSFTYRAYDGTAYSNVAIVSINVGPANDMPVAMPDVYGTPEDTQLVIAAPGVLGNDSDVDGDELTAWLVQGPTHGTLTLNSDGGFVYTPAANYFGSDSFTYTASDGDLTSNLATVTIAVTAVNDPPDCSNARPSDSTIWPLNKSFTAVNVLGVTDIDGDAITITITGIRQDEPVGNDDPYDAFGVGTSTAWVRAERDGNGDGRVYHIFFTASDGNGGVCTGEVRAATVSHDQGDLGAIDGGPIYDSTIPG
jgi:VCBS repeat-containing protein